mgnify:CR=1 FL=1
MFDALPDWQQLSLYAMAAALLLTLLPRLPYVGQALHAMLSFGVLAICIFFLLQQAPYQPWLAPLLDRVGADSQTVSGDEVRLRMSPDGHFWAEATLNGVETRMLVRRQHVYSIAAAWVITVPASALVSASLYFGLSLLVP